MQRKKNNMSSEFPVTDSSKNYTFFENVWDVVRQIPEGRVTTYGAIANYLGTKSSARMVGYAMNSSFGLMPKVPAQRVVNRNGILSGKAHFATSTLMEELLQKEGIQVEDDKIVNFTNVFWDPSIELA
jgi:methylated-DNA-protein-cysteine methyltransferase-like protein